MLNYEGSMVEYWIVLLHIVKCLHVKRPSFLVFITSISFFCYKDTYKTQKRVLKQWNIPRNEKKKTKYFCLLQSDSQVIKADNTRKTNTHTPRWANYRMFGCHFCVYYLLLCKWFWQEKGRINAQNFWTTMPCQ